MPDLQNSNQHLTVSDFTNTVVPIIELLEDKYPKHDAPASIDELMANPLPWRRGGLTISDVIDNNGSQYVDLVQEGGGIHGIALAGYTYVLEKMGVAFSKMASTSAGSINTMLLSAVTTKSELEWMKNKKQTGKKGARAFDEELQYKPEKLNIEDYYETRSEKVLNYLSEKNLSELVDGHKDWRKLILNTFRGQVKFDNIKNYFKKIKNQFILTSFALAVLLIAGALLLFSSGNHLLNNASKWMFGITVVGFIAGIGYLIKQVLNGKHLYNNASTFGINPGSDFEFWIQEKLEENGINNVSQLKNKLQQEQASLQFRYVPAYNDSKLHSPTSENPATNKEIEKLNTELEKIKKHYDNEMVTASLTPGKSKTKITGDLREQLDGLNWNIIKIARKIDPESAEKEEEGNALVKLLVDMNKIKTEVFDYKEDENETNAAYKKEIAIVSSDITNEMKAEFPAMHKLYWGENFSISPAKYVRASMSIPGFFKPFKINYDFSQRTVMEKEWRELLNIDLRLDEEKDKFALLVDGGLLSNFPVNIFFNQDSPLPTKPTVGVKLEFEDENSQNTINSEKEMFGAMVSTMRYFYDRDFMSKHNIFKKTVRSIDTGKVHWLNFDLTDREKIELFFRGALTAAIFLLGKEDENSRAGSVQQLIRMGKKVQFKEKSFCIYEDPEVPTFLTEDNFADVSFNWEKYKTERVLLLSEQNVMRSRIKRKAAYIG